ncbi:MAG: hypothetical protein H6855_01285 [Rhodospirillales bacterium]|nr:hypothetical protein [Rhodospirillales bacterium]
MLASVKKLSILNGVFQEVSQPGKKLSFEAERLLKGLICDLPMDEDTPFSLDFISPKYTALAEEFKSLATDRARNLREQLALIELAAPALQDLQGTHPELSQGEDGLLSQISGANARHKRYACDVLAVTIPPEYPCMHTRLDDLEYQPTLSDIQHALLRRLEEDYQLTLRSSHILLETAAIYGQIVIPHHKDTYDILAKDTPFYDDLVEANWALGACTDLGTGQLLPQLREISGIHQIQDLLVHALDVKTGRTALLAAPSSSPSPGSTA